jgi:hypothetical protein
MSAKTGAMGPPLSDLPENGFYFLLNRATSVLNIPITLSSPDLVALIKVSITSALVMPAKRRL